MRKSLVVVAALMLFSSIQTFGQQRESTIIRDGRAQTEAELVRQLNDQARLLAAQCEELVKKIAELPKHFEEQSKQNVQAQSTTELSGRLWLEILTRHAERLERLNKALDRELKDLRHD